MYMSLDTQHSGRENIFLACNTAGNTTGWTYHVVELSFVLVPRAVAGIRSVGCRAEEDGGDAAVGDGGWRGNEGDRDGGGMRSTEMVVTTTVAILEKAVMFEKSLELSKMVWMAA
jgi:hypothetical protein